jgi:two-component system LytT family response regulator
MDKPSARFFFVRQNGRYVKIPFAEIRYVEASKNYVRIRMADQIHQIMVPLQRLESLLPEEEFIRVHRSFLVGIAYVSSFDNHQVCVEGQAVPIGEFYRHKLNPFILSATPVKSIAKPALADQQGASEDAAIKKRTTAKKS